jgi:hypothetical protein
MGLPRSVYDVWITGANWQGSGAPLDDITLSIRQCALRNQLDPATHDSARTGN